MSKTVHSGLRPLTRLIVVLIVLSPFALAVPEWIDPGPVDIMEWIEDDEPVVITPLPPRTPGERLSIDQRQPVTGFAINAHHISDVSLYLESVDAVAEMGVNALVVLTPMYQRYADSDEIAMVPAKCATDEQLVAILNRARERGLHTTLLPIVLIEQPGEKEWRGVIRPRDWDRWWETYDAFMDRFVNIAVQSEVDLLIVGSELNSTEGMLDRWERQFKRVRQRFKGQIAYSANWDRYDKIRFWPMVDVMCVSSYFELQRDDPEAPEDDLVHAWAGERDKLMRAARKWDKPLLLSEVGYPSVPWASAHPWNYVAPKGTEADHQAQARCWRAFFRAWTQTLAQPDAPIVGFFGYCWSPYHRGDAWDTGYGIVGKPAYDIVVRGMANIRHEAATERALLDADDPLAEDARRRASARDKAAPVVTSDDEDAATAPARD